MSTTGCQYYCDVCQQPILELSDGRGMFAPLDGAADAQAVVMLHDTCRESETAKTFLRGYSTRPLRILLDQADEACNR